MIVTHYNYNDITLEWKIIVTDRFDLVYFQNTLRTPFAFSYLSNHTCQIILVNSYFTQVQFINHSLKPQ